MPHCAYMCVCICTHAQHTHTHIHIYIYTHIHSTNTIRTPRGLSTVRNPGLRIIKIIALKLKIYEVFCFVSANCPSSRTGTFALLQQIYRKEIHIHVICNGRGPPRTSTDPHGLPRTHKKTYFYGKHH